MLSKTNIVDLTLKWNINLDKYVPIVRDIGDVCAVRYDSQGRIFRRDYERGLLLILVALKYQSEYILEFGTGRGFSSACLSILENIVSIYTIDKLDGSKTVDVIRESPHAIIDKIKFIHKRSSNIDKSDFNGQKFDLIFIDGEHTEAAVKTDFHNALLYSTDNAIIVFDDFRKKHAGVRCFIKSLKQYKKTIVSTDGWFYDNIMIHKHGDADKIVNGKEYDSGQVILYKI